MIDLKFDILGNIEKDFKDKAKELEKSLQKAIRETAYDAQQSWRRQILFAGLGNRLPKTVRFKVYKNNGYDPAFVVFTKAPKLIRAFDRGVTIRPRRGKYLAIPTENAPKKGVGSARRSTFQAKASPRNFPEHRFGKLRFIQGRGGRNPVLVADGLQKTYSRKTGAVRGYKKASKRTVKRRQQESVVMYVLLPQIRLRKRLSLSAVRTKSIQNISKNLDKYLSDKL